jgi:probable F420-dependent oxidoreductase
MDALLGFSHSVSPRPLSIERASYGLNIPLPGIPLSDHRSWFEELSELGYTDMWSGEVDGPDAFTPLALAVASVPTVRVGTAVVPVFTRGPAVLAQSAAAMAEAAPGRFTLGIGTSSEMVVSRWNGIPFIDPVRRLRDVIRFLRSALSGCRVDEQFDTFSVRGFRLERPPAVVPPIVLAALRPTMLRLAGSEADGAVLSWVGANDVGRAAREVGVGKELVAKIFVCPTEDAEAARAIGRRAVAAYLNVPAYAEQQDWLGRGPLLQEMWDLWKSGDRKGALAAIPDRVVDDLVLHGSPQVIRSGIRDYVENGVTVPVLAIIGAGDCSLQATLRALSPRSA